MYSLDQYRMEFLVEFTCVLVNSLVSLLRLPQDRSEQAQTVSQKPVQSEHIDKFNPAVTSATNSKPHVQAHGPFQPILHTAPVTASHVPPKPHTAPSVTAPHVLPVPSKRTEPSSLWHTCTAESIGTMNYAIKSEEDKIRFLCG